MTSFSEALERHVPEAIDPRTGEPINLADYPHAPLVDVFLALQEREHQFKEWRTAVENELVRRHGDKRAAEVVGDHEVDVSRGSTREWDVDDLRTATDDLVGQGLLRPDQVADLFKPQPAWKVDGNEAKRLVDHAEGDVLVELSRCFTWKKGRAKVKVTPVVQLEQ